MKPMTERLTFPANTTATRPRTAVIAGEPYEIDGTPVTFDAPFERHDLQSAAGPVEVITLPASVRTSPFFAGADGLRVWRAFVASAEFDDVVSLSECSEAYPWCSLRNGRVVSPTMFGANQPGSYAATRGQQ